MTGRGRYRPFLQTQGEAACAVVSCIFRAAERGSGGLLVELFAATSAPQNVVVKASRPTEIYPLQPLAIPNSCRSNRD